MTPNPEQTPAEGAIPASIPAQVAPLWWEDESYAQMHVLTQHNRDIIAAFHLGRTSSAPPADKADTRPDPRVEEIRRKVQDRGWYGYGRADVLWLLSELDRLRKGERS